MKTILAALGLALFLSACGQSGKSGDQSGTAPADSQAPADISLDDKAAKRSYALGMDIGKSLRDVPVELSIKHLTRGLTDMLENRKPLLSEEELRSTMQAMMSDLETARKEKASAEAEANAKAGKAFLAENKTEEGVKVTDSGLQYKVLEAGDGPSPAPGDRVKVHYVGKLIDGTVFDSSRERGEPVTFPVDAVIPGWTEALQLMQEGARYKLFIPPELAYGERGAGANIGPNETLIFTVELLDVLREGESAQGSDSTDSGEGADGSQ